VFAWEAVRPLRRQRLCVSSVLLAGLTGLIMALVVVTGICERIWPIAPVIITVYVCIGTLQHANIRWGFGPAGRVLVSPAYHRFHHASDDPFQGPG
jgi:sterol desaturase/sphingolipid hydroxylase (fatty acid hydroxylase superfamily)